MNSGMRPTVGPLARPGIRKPGIFDQRPRGARRSADIALAAGQASQHGAPVRFLGAILVADEETCFWLYQAPSAGAVRAAMTRALLRPERIAPAVPVRPPEARPDPAPRTGSTTRAPAPSPDPASTSPHQPHHTSPPAPGTGPP